MKERFKELLQRRAAPLLGGDFSIYRLQHAGNLALLGERGEGDESRLQLPKLKVVFPISSSFRKMGKINP